MQSAEKGRQRFEPKAVQNVITHIHKPEKKKSANRRACLDYVDSLTQSHLSGGCQMTICLVSFVTAAGVTSAIVSACVRSGGGGGRALTADE